MENPIIYHQSSIKNIFECPRKFWLSMRESPDIAKSTTRNMDEGTLIEYYAIGKNVSDGKADELMKGKKAKTLERLKKVGDAISVYFDDGEKQKHLTAPFQDFLYTGTFDYYHGLILHDGHRIYANADLKCTGDIVKLWDTNAKRRRVDFLQAVTYTWLDWKITGEILPFIYVIAEMQPTHEKEVMVKTIKINIRKHDFEWWEGLMEDAHHINMLPEEHVQTEDNPQNCLGGWMKSRCWYIDKCPAGKKLITKSENIDFSNLT